MRIESRINLIQCWSEPLLDTTYAMIEMGLHRIRQIVIGASCINSG